MSDFYFDLSGDIKISPNKDIAMVDNGSMKDVQQIYIRLMTEPNDFTVYPRLGFFPYFIQIILQDQSTR
jgi:hypothetical protein